MTVRSVESPGRVWLWCRHLPYSLGHLLPHLLMMKATFEVHGRVALEREGNNEVAAGVGTVGDPEVAVG